jgi:aspartyl-tRNA(Asn)/glutamyl-tRNA(Gln) amidotransferase subunit B
MSLTQHGFIPVLGLEIHAELLTKSKVFCTCTAEFGGDENSRVCPRCAGLPGTLPVLNQEAIRYAAKAGIALGCDINLYNSFDRKNYFYPDLPKAYQITQFEKPVCINGHIDIDGRTIRVNRIHLEEDAGKLVHDAYEGISLADYNRCGVPLIEIVTEPDITSAEEAKAFVEEVALRLKYADVCDCKMEEGSLRVDVNISLMRPEDKQFGTRAKIKNLNSLKSIVRAVEHGSPVFQISSACSRGSPPLKVTPPLPASKYGFMRRAFAATCTGEYIVPASHASGLWQ